MNSVILTGRLTRDAEVSTYGKGKEASKVARFTVAVRDGKNAKGEATAQFIRCVAFGTGAEIMEQFTGKGQVISVRGRLKNGSYEDEKGVTRYTTDVIVEDIDLFGQASEEEPKEKTSKYHR